MSYHQEKAEEILERLSQSQMHVTVAEAQVHATLALVEELKLQHETRPCYFCGEPSFSDATGKPGMRVCYAHRSTREMKP